jgi:hypothetical protein
MDRLNQIVAFAALIALADAKAKPLTKAQKKAAADKAAAAAKKVQAGIDAWKDGKSGLKAGVTCLKPGVGKCLAAGGATAAGTPCVLTAASKKAKTCTPVVWGTTKAGANCAAVTANKATCTPAGSSTLWIVLGLLFAIVLIVGVLYMTNPALFGKEEAGEQECAFMDDFQQV